ncbi:hypothetical protein ACU8DI_05295 [Psychroserpens sp. BH13MA-6]
MKKALLIFVGILVIAIGLLYWSLSSTSKSFQRCVILNHDDVNTIDFRSHDSVLVAASTLYNADDIKLVVQGEQYRDAWSTPVNVPILFLDTLFGGVTILKEGGGKQTHSLKLQSKNGIIYTLRSINKDPEPLVPEFAKTLGLENIIVDGISAQHPYAAILVAELAEAADVIHTHPKAVFVPKQKALNSYNEKYGNRLFLLEYETEGDVNWTHLSEIEELLDTEDLQELKLESDIPVRIDKNTLIRSRLFDLLIGDWDRHTKQWGWAVQRRTDSLVAYPIAGDRDNAFFNTEGIVPSIMTNEYVVPELRPFKNDIDFMPGLVYPFDRYFLIDTPEEKFVAQAEQLQLLLTDDVIDDALTVWTKELNDLHGKSITDKIKHRRDQLVIYAKAFKKNIDEKGKVKEALKGSEDLELPAYLKECFSCN